MVHPNKGAYVLEIYNVVIRPYDEETAAGMDQIVSDESGDKPGCPEDAKRSIDCSANHCLEGPVEAVFFSFFITHLGIELNSFRRTLD